MINTYNFNFIEKYGYVLLNKYETKLKYSSRTEFFCVAMIPYPSGKLHIGHFRNYCINDFICRYKNLKNKKSFVHFGWDSFGLPAEKAALSKNISPAIWVKKNIKYMKTQIKKMVFLILWEKEINTCSKDYIFYNKKIFNIFFKNNLIYRKKSWVNWDPIDKTVLANEQVINGRGWRSNCKIVKKKIYMYFINLKKIINSLYKKTFYLKWPQAIINSQIKWINKQKYYFFYLFNKKKTKIRVFLKNRFDFLNTNKIIYPLYIKKDIFGVLQAYSKNKIINNKFFIYFNNRKIFYKLHIDDKALINEAFFSATSSKINKIFKHNKLNIIKYINNIIIKTKYLFNLRNWSISRQRVWGTPIPILKCQKCGIIFNNKQKCLLCKKKCKKETDTLDTFFDSSWYFLKYFYKNPLHKTKKKINIYIGGVEHSVLHLLYVRIFFLILNKLKILSYINPFKKLIIHGMVLKHSFFNKKKLIYENEKNYLKNKKNYIIKLEKMSKSKKNVINPLTLINKFGSDASKMYILFLNEPKKDIVWKDIKISGCVRFLKKVWEFFINFNIKKIENFKCKYKLKYIQKNIIKLYKIKKTNLLISNLMVLFKNIKTISNKKTVFNNNFLNIVKKFILFLHPVCPIITSVLWHITGINKQFGNIYNNNPFK
ncbi:class I tRNA ligase family protein [Candidatus Vidania fulgoroideorum]